MNLKALWADYPPASKLLLAIGIFIISMIVFGLLSFGIIFFFYRVPPSELQSLLDNLSGDRAIEIAKVFQSVSSIGCFILSAWFLAYLFSDEAKGYLKLDKGVNKYSVLFVIIALIVALPLINYLGDINSKMSFPSFLSGVEKWMRDYEDRADRLTESLLKMNSPGEMIFNVMMIALIPAIGEELFFRGILQRIFIDWSKNKHWGIWLTAAIFSAIHFEFFGFLPRMLLGALLGYLFVWSGSLWLPMIGHFVNNASAIVLAYLFRNVGSGLNPDKIGAEGDNLLPVIISVFLFTFLLVMIYMREKREREVEIAEG